MLWCLTLFAARSPLGKEKGGKDSTDLSHCSWYPLRVWFYWCKALSSRISAWPSLLLWHLFLSRLFTVQLAQLPGYSTKQLKEQSWHFKMHKTSAIFILVNPNFIKCSEHPGVQKIWNCHHSGYSRSDKNILYFKKERSIYFLWRPQIFEVCLAKVSVLLKCYCPLLTRQTLDPEHPKDI